jgi:hypothetical protein
MALNISITNYPNGISSFGVPVLPGPTVFGNVWFVNTAATEAGQGNSPYSVFTTMAQAFSALSSNDVIMFRGTVREQLVAPLGVTGVQIIGAVGGQVRDDNGAKWTTPASGAVAGKALLELREQGWSVQNFLMTPDSTAGACIKAHRNEDATYPDSSHFQALNMRFVGAGGYGIQDVGGNSNYLVQGCKFQSLAKGIYCSSTSIAVPTRNQILNNEFYGNDDDIETSLIWSTIQGNRFHTAGDGTHTVINSASNAGQGSNNIIDLNWFNNGNADIDPAHGFTGTATDVWSNYSNDQAALVVGQPA